MEDVVSGAKIASCLLALAVTCLPLCLRLGDGLVHSRLALLWYSLNPLFCEQVRLCLRSELFTGKFSFSLSFLSLSLFFFPLFGYPTVWVAISGWLPQTVLRAFRPHPYLKHAAHTSLFSPCPLLADLRASGLLLCWELQLGT